MYDSTSDKQVLHFLFFQKEPSKPIADHQQCTPYTSVASPSPNLNVYNQPYSQYIQANYNWVMPMECQSLKKKGKMLVECPHKDKKHYAKVLGLLRICA